MAIYKNREVYLVATHVPSNTNVELIAVQYTNGMRDNVPLGQVKFTEEEKKALIKDNPNKFDNIEVATKEDVEAVRVGVTPPSDPSFKEAAEVKVQAEAQQKKLAEMNKAAEDNARKNFEKKVKPDVIPANAANPQSNQLQQKAK